jgi:mannose-6-phosphate isomerase-like protein (cupin superfamily)
MSGSERSCLLALDAALARIPGPAGEHSVSLLERGTLKIKMSRPVRPNVQAPHEQDEIYVVARGEGVIVHGGRAERCRAGDAVFIAAGTEHRFEDFSDDLAVWVVFFGPPGGEAPLA